MTDYNGDPINYRFEYIKDLEIIVPEGEGVEKYLCAGEICENCGGIKETCP